MHILQLIIIYSSEKWHLGSTITRGHNMSYAYVIPATLLLLYSTIYRTSNKWSILLKNYHLKILLQ